MYANKQCVLHTYIQAWSTFDLFPNGKKWLLQLKWVWKKVWEKKEGEKIKTKIEKIEKGKNVHFI